MKRNENEEQKKEEDGNLLRGGQRSTLSLDFTNIKRMEGVKERRRRHPKRIKNNIKRQKNKKNIERVPLLLLDLEDNKQLETVQQTGT